MSKHGGGEEKEGRLTEAFSFRHELIRPGDVLLCTRPSDAISRVIRKVTDGRFSHAAICTKSPIFLEADSTGVCSFSIERFLVNSPDHARILRLKSEFDPDSKFSTGAAAEASRYETGRYDKMAAIASVFGGAKFDSGLFCSYIVSAAYVSAGQNIAGGRAPRAATPAEIEQSGYFDDITATVLKRVALGRDGRHYFLDRSPQYPEGEVDEGDVETPNQLYTRALQTVAGLASRFLESKGLSRFAQYTDIFGVIVSHRADPWFGEFDGKLASWIDDLAYPVLTAAQTHLEQAQARDTERLLDQIEDDLSEGHFRAIAAQECLRIETTQELLRQRAQTVDLFEQGRELFGWKVFAAWLRCEILVEQCLITNLMMYDQRLEYLWVFAEGKSWEVSDLDQKYSIVKRALELMSRPRSAGD
jgi:hypothetical protein